MTDAEKLAQIKWACRRGMLELDFIFTEFLDSGFGKLSDIEKNDFLKFLDNEDPDLYSWLMGFREPLIEADIEMVKLIRTNQIQ